MAGGRLPQKLQHWPGFSHDQDIEHTAGYTNESMTDGQRDAWRTVTSPVELCQLQLLGKQRHVCVCVCVC